MTSLYVANTSKQRFTFEFRRPESARIYLRFINPGEQLEIRDFSSAEIDLAIRHFGAYGMIDATRIDQSRAFIGQCYSIGKPVPHKIMVKAMKDNDDHLDRAGHERRKTQVAATEQSLRTAAHEQGTGYRGDLEFEVDEVRGPELNKELLSETLGTSSPGAVAKPPKGNRRR